MNNFFSVGNQADLNLNNFSWEDKVFGFDECRGRAALEKSNFRPEDFEESEIFIRELVQNALDAKDRSSNDSINRPVVISIKYCEIDMPYRKVYKSMFPRELKEWLVESGDLEKDYATKFHALVLSDYGTHGLEEEDWKKYFFGSGKGHTSSKVNKSLGSKNQGKVAIWALSTIWSVFCKTHLLNGDIKGQGQCLMSEWVELEKGDKKRSPDAYYKRKDGDIMDFKEISMLEKVFKIKKRSDKEFGTDFILLEAIKTPYENIIQSILKNWSIPIAEGELEFKVDDEDINRRNIYKLIDLHKSKLGEINSEYIKFCLDARRGSERVVSYELRNDLTIEKLKERILSVDHFTEDIKADNLFEDFNKNKIVEVKFYPRLSFKNKPASYQHAFSVFITKKENQLDDSEKKNKSFGLILRDYQVLWGEVSKISKASKSREDIYFLINSCEDKFEDLMKLFEEPSHLNFNQKNIKFDSSQVPYERNNAKSNLSIFRQSANKLINYMLSADIKDEPNFFSSLFPYVFEDEKKINKPKPKRKNDVTKPNPPVIDVKSKSKPAINIEQKQDTIRIKSTKDYEWSKGDRFTVKFAASSLEGAKDPFKDYSIFDFDFSDSSRFRIPVESGCDVLTCERNVMFFEAFDNEFEIVIQGFHPHWGYTMRYRYENIHKDESEVQK